MDCRRWPQKKYFKYEAQAVLDRRKMREAGAGPSVTVYACGDHWHIGNRDRFAKLDERIPKRRGRARK